MEIFLIRLHSVLDHDKWKPVGGDIPKALLKAVASACGVAAETLEGGSAIEWLVGEFEQRDPVAGETESVIPESAVRFTAASNFCVTLRAKRKHEIQLRNTPGGR
jgi:hypothetical protein